MKDNNFQVLVNLSKSPVLINNSMNTHYKLIILGWRAEEKKSITTIYSDACLSHVCAYLCADYTGSESWLNAMLSKEGAWGP